MVGATRRANVRTDPASFRMQDLQRLWLRKTDSEYEALETKLKACDLEIRAFKDAILGINEQLDQKVVQNAAQREELAECTGRLGECGDKLHTCSLALAQARKDAERLHAVHNGMVKTITDLERENTDLVADVQRLQGDMSDCTGRLGDCSARLGSCNVALAAAQNEANRFETTRLLLEQRTEERDREIRDLRAEIGDLQTQLQTATQERAREREELGRERLRWEHERDAAAAATDAASDALRRTVADLRAENGDLQTRLQTATQDRARAEEERLRWEHERDASAAADDALRRTVAELRAELDASGERIAACNAERETFWAHTTACKEALRACRESNDEHRRQWLRLMNESVTDGAAGVPGALAGDDAAASLAALVREADAVLVQFAAQRRSIADLGATEQRLTAERDHWEAQHRAAAAQLRDLAALGPLLDRHRRRWVRFQRRLFGPEGGDDGDDPAGTSPDGDGDDADAPEREADAVQSFY